jgi:hypothetical protein
VSETTTTTAAAVTARLTADVVARLLPKIGTANERGCWPWLGGCSRDGYPYLSIGHLMVGAHRIVVELWSGQPIPPRMQVDHTCFNRRCVNPGHLQVVTQVENLRRSRLHGQVAT